MLKVKVEMTLMTLTPNKEKVGIICWLLALVFQMQLND
jgi:hypothetical protein